MLAVGVLGEEQIGALQRADYDEIVRKVKVARAEELKDAASQQRLEKVLTLFEKEWMKQSGYKKTTIKKGMKAAKGGKKEKAPKDKKNEEMDTVGKDLKAWMKKEDIWQKDLYDQLLALDISGEEDLNKLDQTQIDEVLRKVRVEKVSTLKDQKARNRVDKLLTSFEKKWKAATGKK